jgi:hypothetical protein
VVETEGFNIVKEQVPNLEHSDLKRRILQEKDARRRSSVAVQALHGQKARLEEELAKKATLVRHAWV